MLIKRLFFSGVFFIFQSANLVQADIYIPSGVISEVNAADFSMLLDDSKGQLPGVYHVSIYLNGKFIVDKDVRFIVANNKKECLKTNCSTGLQPYLTYQDIALLGLNFKQLSTLSKVEDGDVIILEELIPGAFTEFDFSRLRLNFSIPQAELNEQIRHSIPTEYWDNGITAALLNYNISGNQRMGRYGDSRDHMVRLDSGINIGAWRLRDSRIWTYRDNADYTSNYWEHTGSYIERAIAPLNSHLLIGDGQTDGMLFSPVGFRGGQIATDEDMLLDSYRGFAPVIRGVANSTAEIIVRQRGYVVYQMVVPPGPFTIKDLYAMGTSGDLDVTVVEADGSQQVFSVPYSTIPAMVREGYMKYGLTIGQLRNNSKRYKEPLFIQGAIKQGLSNEATVYGGMQYSDKYLATSVGVGMNLAQIGALSADVTLADSKLTDGSQHKGQSLRLLYSWFSMSTDTTFNLVGCRYSSQGFHTLNETALKGMSGWLYDYNQLDERGEPLKNSYTDYYDLYNSRKGSFEANISQKIGLWGSIYLSGYREDYWNLRGATNSWQAGVNGSVNKIGYGLSGRWQKSAFQDKADKSISLHMSVPLHTLFGQNRAQNIPPMQATFSLTEDRRGNVNQFMGVSGTALDNNQLNWNLSQGYSRFEKEMVNTNLRYQGAYGNLNAGYGHGRNYNSINYGFSGGVLLHQNGVTLGPSFPNSAVLVYAPNAYGAKLGSASAVTIDTQGYAINPIVSSYRKNKVSLDMTSLPDKVDFDGAVYQVVPTRGAIVKVNFNTVIGQRVLMTLKHNGKPLPFGAIVTGGNASGIVDEEGQVFLSGLTQQGRLRAQWGQADNQQCTVDYQLPTMDENPFVIYPIENCH